VNILIIDNKSKHTDKLVQLLSDYEVRVVRYRKRTHPDCEWADLIILSGGNKPFLFKRYFLAETTLIQQTNKPIIGICLGFELIASAFGENLSRRRGKIYGVRQIQLCSDYFGLEDKRKYNVFQAHRWTVNDPQYLDMHAKSVDGAEIIKHPTKQIIGFQFHPEVITPPMMAANSCLHR
jgi:anthranilate/para-aminobenzoate synthase component II